MAKGQLLAQHEGHRAVSFVEQFCIQSKGAEGGSRIKLRQWQRDLYIGLLQPGPNGKRKNRTALIGVAKKNGKSLLGSTLATYFLNLDPEPGGEIYSAAAAKDQAGIVFNETKKMVEASPTLTKRCKVYRDVIECVNGTVYRVIAADARTQDGINPSVCIFDEVHRQPDSELWSIVQMGMAARSQPLLIGITTAGDGPEGICWDLYDYGKRLQSGEIEDPTFFFRWWEPKQPDADFRDPAVWQEANPGLGDFLSYEAVEAESKQLPEGDFRRLRLNQWPAGAGDWLPAGLWDELTISRQVSPKEVEIVFAFDGSFTDDSTAIVGATIEKNPHIMVMAKWEKPINEPTWRVPLDEVKAKVFELIDEWKPSEFVIDPSGWKDVFEAISTERPKQVLLEYPQSPARMVPATQQFFQAASGHALSHDGNKALARHIGNAKLVQTARGSQIRKETKGSKKKIDLAVAALMAVDRARALFGKKPRKHGVWDLNELLKEKND